jgi:site-specific DNA recombinase
MQETRVSPKGPGGKGHERMAVGYTRVSTQEQAREGASLQAQRERIEGHCKAQGLDLLGVQTDEGISGRKTVNRPGLEQALTEVCRIKGTLVVYSLSRLARSTKDALAIADRLQRCGAQLVSLVEHVDTTSPTGRFFFTVMASLAALESEVNGERVAMAMRHKRTKGEKWCSHAPFGFMFADGTLKPEPSEQALVEAAMRLRKRGVAFREVAAKLNARGFP